MTLAGRIAPLVSLLYPPVCESCGAGIEHSGYLCARCAGKVERIHAPFCQLCSEPFRGAITGAFSCPNCAERKFAFDCAVAPYRSRGIVRDFIHRFKYFREYHLRHTLAGWAHDALTDERLMETSMDALVPVPLFRARQRHREFNQAAVIARLVGQRAGIPVAEVLQRTRNTSSQLAFDRGGRMENLRNAFSLRHSRDVRGLHLVLVDDVLTTGSTLDECARVLLAAGAASVRALTIARG